MRPSTIVVLSTVVLACGRFTLDDGHAEVTGQVIDVHGAPVAGVRVMLIRDRRPISETTSAADGRFRLVGTPGSAAVFGLQSSSTDQGVWRPDLDLLPTGQTDVGQLELETVWAHPEVLWLRGTGFDEQLSRPEDDLTYLWGGGPGELLLGTRLRRDGQELVRVADDGTATVLGVGSGADVTTVPDGGVPTFLLPATDVSGATVVLQQFGGVSVVTAAGAHSIPIVRLAWLDARTGSTVLDVAVPDPETASVSVVAGRGALVSSRQGVFFASLDQHTTVSLPAGSEGRLLANSRGLFVAHESSTDVWLSRLDANGRLTDGRHVPRPEGVIDTLGTIDDTLARVSHAAGSMTVMRFDGDTLAPSVETLSIGEDPELGSPRSQRWMSTCSRSPSQPSAFEELFDQGLRLTRIGARTTTQRQWRVGAVGAVASSWQGCSTADGFWRVLRPPEGGLQLLRASGATVELTELPADVVAVDQMGPWPVLVKHVNGRTERTVLPPDASLTPRVLSRVPFVLPMGTPSLDGQLVYASGLSADGHRSIFRVPSPFREAR